MDTNKIASKRLKSLRIEKNMTQEELAEDLHISQQTVAKYENCKLQFKPDFLFKLSKYFDVSVNTFFSPLNDKEVNNSIINKIRMLNKNKLKKIEKIIDLELEEQKN